nr:ORF2 [Epsilontorquevirus sp.]
MEKKLQKVEKKDEEGVPSTETLWKTPSSPRPPRTRKKKTQGQILKLL